MSLTKSTFRFAAGGNCETSTSVALAPGHANKAANSNRARRRAFRLIHLRRAESILTRLNISIDVRLTGESLNDSFRRAHLRFFGGHSQGQMERVIYSAAAVHYQRNGGMNSALPKNLKCAPFRRRRTSAH